MKARRYTAFGVLLSGLSFAFLSAASPTLAQLLEVRAASADLVPEEASSKVKGIKNATKVERYLLVRTEPYEVIGVEPGAPLRILIQGDRWITGRLEAGKSFKKEDDGKGVAIVGKVYAEDYGIRARMGGMAGMPAMKHYFDIGQSFKLKEIDERIRVIGRFTAQPESEAAKVFLPLSTAQLLYGHSGKISVLFVEVNSPENVEQVKKEIEVALGALVQVIPR